MNIIRGSGTFQLCRLCGRCDRHKIDILKHELSIDDKNARKLCETIFICVGIQVTQIDKMTTKLCENCLTKINYIVRFRELCAATEMQMRILMGSPNKTSDSNIGLLNFASAPGAATSSRKALDENLSLNGETAVTRKRPRSDIDPSDFETNVKKTMKRDSDSPSTTHSLADQPSSPITNQDVIEIECTENTIEECLAVDLPSIHGDDDARLALPADEQDENEKTRNAACVLPEPDSITARTTNETIAPPTVSENVVTGRNDEIVNVYEPSKTQKKKFPAKKKTEVCGKVDDNEKRFHIQCKAPAPCKELFESTEAMMFHMTSYHAKGIKRNFDCHLCGRTYARKINIQRHMTAVHIGLKRFKCSFPKCSKTFTQKGNLQVHTNAIHTKKVAFKCTKCRGKFYQKVHLTRHLANKHGQGITHRCYLCKKSLGSKGSLQRHMNAIHIGLKRFKCSFPKCSKAFAQKINLQKHINSIHTKIIEFKCAVCTKNFFQKANLTKHLAAKHGVNFPTAVRKSTTKK